jgi:hypothetical protein
MDVSNWHNTANNVWCNSESEVEVLVQRNRSKYYSTYVNNAGSHYQAASHVFTFTCQVSILVSRMMIEAH